MTLEVEPHTPSFLPCTVDDTDAVVAWLTSHAWPFHVAPTPDPDLVRDWIAKGQFWGEDARSFWVVVGDERTGLLSLQELADDTPVFDLRMATPWRGRGLGRIAVKWLTGHVFGETDKRRLEAHTRGDNAAMRCVLRACGWIKEAHYRSAWPDEDGAWHDAVAYAVLKDDWAQNTVTPVPWDDEP